MPGFAGPPGATPPAARAGKPPGTALIATYDPALIDIADDVLLMQDGMLVPDPG